MDRESLRGIAKRFKARLKESKLMAMTNEHRVDMEALPAMLSLEALYPIFTITAARRAKRIWSASATSPNVREPLASRLWALCR